MTPFVGPAAGRTVRARLYQRPRGRTPLAAADRVDDRRRGGRSRRRRGDARRPALDSRARRTGYTGRPCHHAPETPSSSTSPRSPTAGRASRALDEFVVFVRGAVPGDRVRARVTKRKQSHAEARTLEILSPSPRRVAPRCRHSQECGGCEWQTLSYEAQLEFKQQQVVDSLQRLAHLEDYELEPIRGMDDPWRYRNKMEFSFGADEDGRLVLGPAQARLLEGDRRHRRLRAGLGAHEPRPAGRRRGLPRPRPAAVLARGRRRPAAPPRRARGTRRAATCCSTCSSPPASPRRPSSPRASPPQSGCTSFALTVNESRADAAVGDGPHMLLGPPYLRERLAGVDLRVPATAFLQTNSAMCEVLYDTALRFAAPEPARPSVDLYCGIGSLSLPLARGSREVHAIEIQEEAIDAARVNAELNGVGNAVFYAADVRPLLRFPPHPVLDAGAAGRRRPAGRGRRRPAARRPGAQGAAARRGARRRPLRLRLVQPDDARRQRAPSSRSSATASSASRRSTCSRTRTTSRRSRSSSARG